MASSSSSSSTAKIIKLKTSDNQTIDVAAEVAADWKVLKPNLEDNLAVGEDGSIPLPNVTSEILNLVIRYSTRHLEAKNDSSRSAADDLKAWDENFMNEARLDTILEIVKAANYLSYEDLLNLTCGTIANMIKGKTPEQIRENFGIVNDLSPEDQAKVDQETRRWTFM